VHGYNEAASHEDERKRWNNNTWSLLWKSYQDNKRLIFGETIASIIVMLRIWNFGKNSRISWDDLYMHQFMFIVSCSGLYDLGRNTLKISYGAWRMSSYHMDTVLSERVRLEIWKLWALKEIICQVDFMIFLCWNDFSCMIW